MTVFLIVIIIAAVLAFAVIQLTVIIKTRQPTDDNPTPRANRDMTHVHAKNQQQTDLLADRARRREIRDLERAFRR